VDLEGVRKERKRQKKRLGELHYMKRQEYELWPGLRTITTTPTFIKCLCAWPWAMHSPHTYLIYAS